MKILQVTPVFPPHVGGMEEYVLNLSKELIHNKHSVDIFTSQLPINTEKSDRIENIRVTRFHSLFQRSADDTFSPQLLSKLVKSDFDVINSHGYLYYYTIAANIRKLIRKGPIVFTFHGDHIQPTLFRKIIKFFRDKTEGKFILDYCDRIIATTNKNQEILMNKYQIPKSKISLIPCGVDSSFYDVNLNGDSFRKRFGLSNKKIILFVGRLEKYKGPQYLIHSLNKLLKLDPDFRLVIVGDGTYRNQLIKEAKKYNLTDKILFTGFIPKPLLRQVYAAADVFVSASAHEPFGMVLLEAMATGTPIIALKDLGIFQLFNKQDFLKFLINEISIDNLVSKILEIFEDLEKIRTFTQKSKEFIVKNFSWEIIGKKVQRLYEKCV